ncbi:uncharacterized protein LOC114307497 [Camellia sinensis]|uniref:uncharacterized protein LOC114307497 n=1 Tax=Camellia sinensis TaxID=4442 RepID=UPI001035B340|nr:uncharacterized protein LOC114307497 [Camellia sinensis]
MAEQVGQAEVLGQPSQAAMGALAREIAGALRESMNILRVETQERENVAETRASFLTREFLRAKPDEFHGGPNPKKRDEWLEQTVKTFDMLHTKDGELRVTLASYYLKGDAGQWWKYAKDRIAPTWEAFVTAFKDKYLPLTTRERLRQEFKDLKQLNMSMAEFETAFSSLFRFAPELVATEERRCFEFEQRLRTKILFKVAEDMIREYDRLVEAARVHQGAASAHVLIDTCASHSFIPATFTSALGLELVPLASPLRVESPVGGTVDLDRGCHGYEIEVAGCRLPFAFVLLDMSSFDVILGMVWLSSYRAVIDCFRQRVTECTSGGDYFYFLGDRVDWVLSSVFDPRSRNELSSLLATLLDSESVETRVELPRVVCEYPEVFPEDLTSLPPHQEVEFTIDLVPGMVYFEKDYVEMRIMEL